MCILLDMKASKKHLSNLIDIEDVNFTLDKIQKEMERKTNDNDMKTALNE
jgi:hypothetical protein